MSKIKTHVNKGDTAEVISGVHKGKKGTVISVNVKKQQVLLDDVRLVMKAVKPTQENQSGGIIEQNAPIALSNVKKVS